MRKLLLIPMLALVLACEDAAVYQPDADPLFAPASRPLMVLTWQQMPDQYFSGKTWLTPSGIIQIRNAHSGAWVTGDVEGYAHVYGQGHIDTRTGRGEGSGHSVFELTSPGVGTLECTWTNTTYDWPVLRQYSKFTCQGTGYYEGWKVKAEGTNEANPGSGPYTITAEVR
jgi:hypothetical protein